MFRVCSWLTQNTFVAWRRIHIRGLYKASVRICLEVNPASKQLDQLHVIHQAYQHMHHVLVRNATLFVLSRVLRTESQVSVLVCCSHLANHQHAGSNVQLKPFARSLKNESMYDKSVRQKEDCLGCTTWVCGNKLNPVAL